jgi:adenylate cyclase
LIWRAEEFAAIIRFDRFVLDQDRGALLADGIERPLRPKAFALLCHLIANTGRLVSRDEIHQAIWPGVFVTDDSIAQVVREVRVALNDAAASMLRTVPRRGYLFTAEVRDDAQDAKGARDAPPLPERPSIAVLPFQNMSGDPDQEYFADGTVEEITTALSRIRWLFVIARNSAFAWRGRAVDVREIGRELGVRYVLEGSVRRGGDRVRVTAQLIDAATGAHIWAERYDRGLTDIFAVQDDIAGSVASIVEPTLNKAEQQRAMSKPPEQLDAWEACARAYWHHYKGNAADNKTAQTYFRKSIELDAGFARPHYGLAMSCWYDYWAYSVTPLSEARMTALTLARRAVAVDANDPMAHAMLAVLTLTNGEWDHALSMARTAWSLNPNNAFVISTLGLMLIKGGLYEEAVEQLRQAIRMSPFDPTLWVWHLWITWARFHQGHFEQAIEAARDVLRFRPEFANATVAIAVSLAYLGRLDEARASFNLLREKYPERLARFYQQLPWDRPEEYGRLLEGLRLAAGEQGPGDASPETISRA